MDYILIGGFMLVGIFGMYYKHKEKELQKIKHNGPDNNQFFVIEGKPEGCEVGEDIIVKDTVYRLVEELSGDSYKINNNFTFYDSNKRITPLFSHSEMVINENLQIGGYKFNDITVHNLSIKWDRRKVWYPDVTTKVVRHIFFNQKQPLTVIAKKVNTGKESYYLDIESINSETISEMMDKVKKRLSFVKSVQLFLVGLLVFKTVILRIQEQASHSKIL